MQKKQLGDTQLPAHERVPARSRIASQYRRVMILY